MDEELNGQIVPEKYFLRFYFKLSKCLKYLNQLKPKCVLLSKKKEEEEERNSIKGFSSLGQCLAALDATQGLEEGWSHSMMQQHFLLQEGSKILKKNLIEQTKQELK